MPRTGWARLATAFLASAASRAAAQGIPELRYDPPANFYKSASTSPEDYSSTEVNASFQVYAFRRFGGDLLQSFQRTLLREWIDPRYQEVRLAAPPMFGRDTVPGAQVAFTARFIENVGGMPKEHVRLVIVSNGAAAIVDLSANSAVSWQRVGPAIRATLASLRVVQTTPAIASVHDVTPSAAIGNAFAGVYMGTKQRFKVNLMGSVGSGTFTPALHFYLFSPDGRLYRTYDPTIVPDVDPRRFDYAAAQRSDPENSGRWTVQGNRLVMQIGGPQPEQIVATIATNGGVTINGVLYAAQR